MVNHTTTRRNHWMLMRNQKTLCLHPGFSKLWKHLHLTHSCILQQQKIYGVEWQLMFWKENLCKELWVATRNRKIPTGRYRTVGKNFPALGGMGEKLSRYQPLPTPKEWREYTEHQYISDLIRDLNLKYKSTQANNLPSLSIIFFKNYFFYLIEIEESQQRIMKVPDSQSERST